MAHLVDGWAAHHAFYSHDGAKRWNHQGVAVLKSLQIPANAVEQQIVSVHLFDQLLSPIVLKPPKGTLRCHAASRKQRVQWGGKRTHVIRTGCSNITHHIDAHGAQSKQ